MNARNNASLQDVHKSIVGLIIGNKSFVGWTGSAGIDPTTPPGNNSGINVPQSNCNNINETKNINTTTAKTAEMAENIFDMMLISYSPIN